MTKAGQFLYDMTMGFAKFILKHPLLYYVLNFTWGIIMTVIGLLFTLCMLFCNVTPIRYNLTWYFAFGYYWGGVSLGITFITDRSGDNSIAPHEFGHTVQNCLFGPLFPFLIAIPSMIRYYTVSYEDYEKVWFEKSATDIGKL